MLTKRSGLLVSTMTSQGGDPPHPDGLPLLRLGELPPVVPACSVSLSSTPGSYEQMDHIALHCVHLSAAIFFPCHSFSLPPSLFPIVSKVLSRRQPQSSPLCPRPRTDAETETVLISTQLVRSLARTSQIFHSFSISASGLYCS